MSKKAKTNVGTSKQTNETIVQRDGHVVYSYEEDDFVDILNDYGDRIPDLVHSLGAYLRGTGIPLVIGDCVTFVFWRNLRGVSVDDAMKLWLRTLSEVQRQVRDDDTEGASSESGAAPTTKKDLN